MKNPAQRRIYSTEYDEQVAVMDFCRRKGSPYNRVMVSMSGNIIFYNNFPLIKRLALCGAIGTSEYPDGKGRPDMTWLVARKGYHFLAIELKLNEKAKLTPEEKEYLEWCNNEGGYGTRANGADEAIKIIQDYLEG
jgi:hypothetical protein